MHHQEGSGTKLPKPRRRIRGSGLKRANFKTLVLSTSRLPFTPVANWGMRGALLPFLKAAPAPADDHCCPTGIRHSLDQSDVLSREPIGRSDKYASHMTDVVMTEVIRGMMGAATIMVAAGRAVLADAVSAERCAEYFEVLQQEFPSVIDMAVAGPDKGIVCHAGPSDTAAVHQKVDLLAAKSTPGMPPTPDRHRAHDNPRCRSEPRYPLGQGRRIARHARPDDRALRARAAEPYRRQCLWPGRKPGVSGQAARDRAAHSGVRQVKLREA